jgi:hypothetical protein
MRKEGGVVRCVVISTGSGDGSVDDGSSSRGREGSGGSQCCEEKLMSHLLTLAG